MLDLQVSEQLKRLHVVQCGAIWSGDRCGSGTGELLRVASPIDDRTLAEFPRASVEDLPDLLSASQAAFLEWRNVPAPRRGELVRQFGNVLRQHKHELAAIVTEEAGKIVQESLGEVQEMIDICDFAVGLSRQLYGNTIASERPGHRLAEYWHPLGPVGVISAFNFPVAVWAWNFAISIVCGNSVVWKPSEKTPLSAMACQALFNEAMKFYAIDVGDDLPQALSTLVIGDADVGQAMAATPQLPLLSATGSVAMGRSVAQQVAARLGRSLLELGGNNATIVTPSADLELAKRAVVFAAAGTCGQRCTTLRRLIVHESIESDVTGSLVEIYRRLQVGDPRHSDVLVGPMIDRQAVENMQSAIQVALSQGGELLVGGRPINDGVPGQNYVAPAIIRIPRSAEIIHQETFAPILYVSTYTTLEEAIGMNNAVPQGLSSSILTQDVREAEWFCSAAGSDCGIVNVNIGTSGAEIGGAFGGEKETGGGRESGSDAWKAYMRRVTSTVNYSGQLPLAQGISFEV